MPISPTYVEGWRRWATWTVPSVLFSLISVGVVVGVFGFLLRGARMRSFFTLPVDPALVAAGAAGVSWLVVQLCKGRPSRAFPRAWALALTLAATALAGAAWALPEMSRTVWPHAAAASLAAGALALLPRLISLSPASPWLGRLLPASLLGALLLLILPLFSWSQGRVDSAMADTRAEIAWLHELQNRADTMLQEGSFLLTDNPAIGEEWLGRLQGLSTAGTVEDPQLWQRARLLGVEDDLARGATTLLDTAIQALSPPRAPELARRGRSAVWFDPVAKRWVADEEFPRASENVAAYYREWVRLFRELAPAGTDSAARIRSPGGLESYEDAYRNARARLRSRLIQLLNSWEGSWIVFAIPGHEELVGQGHLELDAMLQAELDPGSEEPLRPAELWRLMELSPAGAMSLAADSPGCLDTRYEEGSYDYTRVDCHAYGLNGSDSAAQLKVEMRLVFRSPSSARRNGHQVPVETYFLFPMPSGKGEDGYQVEVMGELAEAARAHWEGSFRTHDRSGAMTNGFSLVRGGDELRIYRPRIVPFVGNQRAVEVRAEWR